MLSTRGAGVRHFGSDLAYDMQQGMTSFSFPLKHPTRTLDSTSEPYEDLAITGYQFHIDTEREF